MSVVFGNDFEFSCEPLTGFEHTSVFSLFASSFSFGKTLPSISAAVVVLFVAVDASTAHC